MPRGRSARLVAALAAGLAVLGCVALPQAPPAAPPRAAKGFEAPELRIPAAAVAQAPIDIVPLPPLPGDRIGPRPPVPQKAPEAARPVELARPAEPAPAQAPPDGPEAVRPLYRRAAAAVARMDSYIARLTRREQVGGSEAQEEVLLFKFRRKPWSVYFKWLSPAGEGREVVYVKGGHDDKIHTLLAGGDVPLMPAGKRMSFAVDSALVRSASRHPVTEAGLAASVERLGAVLAAAERGDASRGTLLPLGMQQRPEFAAPVPCVEHVIPPRVDPSLPRGGRRLYAFDPDSGLPTLVRTCDDAGHEVEYYFYDRLLCPVGLRDDDFDPDCLWPRRPPGRAADRP